MPSQLLQRLRRFFDQDPAQRVMAHENDPRVDVLGPAPAQDPAKPGKPGKNTNPHWKIGASGNQIANPQTIIIHETSGWPSSASADNFVQRFLCLEYEIIFVPLHGSPPIPAHWDDQIGRAIGPQFYVDGNGTVFSLIGQHNLPDQPRVTVHAEGMSFFAVGIENGDVGDMPGLRPAANANGPFWWRLKNRPEDLPGLMVFALTHPGNPDLNLIWFTTQDRGQAVPRFVGSGDTDDIARRYSNWNNMLFTERNYRGLTLLCRFLLENWGLPRNFLLLPYMRLEADSNDRQIFRRLLLADQKRDQLVAKFHFTLDDVQNDAKNYRDHYSSDVWRSFFGSTGVDLPCFRGIQSHDINGHHPCPGPFFDWHRFAREVWDWWWYPFEIEAPGPSLLPTRRPYLRARGNTPLVDYYYDVTVTDRDYANLAVATEDQARGPSNFALPSNTPIYAMANGVLVAARMPHQTDVDHPGFTLIRHEIFWQANLNRINYDRQPSFVWSLTTFTEIAQADFTQPSDDNPDWLNRLIMRLVECELAVNFHTANPGNASLASAWARVPTGEGPRLASGQLVERDAAAYRQLVTDLQAGGPVLFPLEDSAAPTPVRVILGDFLGPSGTLHDGSAGIQVQIFSKELLPVPNVTQGTIIWSTEDWWRDASAAARHDGVPEADLPQDGLAQKYEMLEFLGWINDITWSSEWIKYGLPGNRPQTPQSREGI